MKQLKYAIQNVIRGKGSNIVKSGIHYFRFACLRYFDC